jgi:hypothetical protein
MEQAEAGERRLAVAQGNLKGVVVVPMTSIPIIVTFSPTHLETP